MTLTVDAHMDVPWVMRKYGHFDLKEGNISSTFNLRWASEGGLQSAFFALYLSDLLQDQLGVAGTKDALMEQVAMIEDQQHAIIVDTPNDAEAAIYAGLFPVFLGIESGRLIGEDLDFLAELRGAGARYMTLTHNRSHSWADSATDNPVHDGISKLGKVIVKACEKLNIFVDVSHASEEAAFDVIEIATKPVIATHSGCKAINDHERNLSDDLIRAIVKTGGVIGVPFVQKFIGSKGVFAHIDHIVQKCGVDCVAIGSDLDGAILVKDVKEVSDWGFFVGDLIKHGYSQQAIAKICGENLLKLMEL